MPATSHAPTHSAGGAQRRAWSLQPSRSSPASAFPVALIGRIVPGELQLAGPLPSLLAVAGSGLVIMLDPPHQASSLDRKHPDRPVNAEMESRGEPLRIPTPSPGGKPVVAAVDWGGTWIRIALATADGQLIGQSRRPRPAGLADQCDLVRAEVAALAAHLSLRPAVLGVGIAGIVRHGRVESAANVGISQPFDLADHLRGRTGLPVVVVNDTQAAAIAEASQLGRGTHVLLTVGTGVGGAIVTGGRLVSGNGAAGDFGHMVVALDGPRCACGGRGCLEQLVSGRILNVAAEQLASTGTSPWLAARAAKVGRVHAGDLDSAAQAGDGHAMDTLDRASAALVAGLRSIAAAIDPDMVILGGGLLSPASMLTRLVHQRWHTARPRWSAIELQPAMQGEEGGLRGAALLAAGIADRVA